MIVFIPIVIKYLSWAHVFNHLVPSWQPCFERLMNLWEVEEVCH